MITLGIIGVVAALTLPGLVQNYQKKVTVSRLKVVYSQLNQAIKMSEAKNGEMSGWNFDELKEDGTNGTKLTEKFVREYIEPYLRTVHKDQLQSSSSPYEYNYYAMDGSLINSNGHTHYSVALNNGVYLHFNATYDISSTMDIRVDINGKQRPNTIGKDTFFFDLYPKFEMRNEGMDRKTLLTLCSKGGDYNTQKSCGALIQADGWEIKDDHPW